ncbi:protein of unknown function [Vibrio tapetis subsp. tapetis]|uniref:Uncharacterized protein n=1 Tax=Vibrio tapetis subsp. tapetis TaxID=1671868 RepID=A0A2N8ZC10_9VIBR|nr:protein of unknown function [Vibrio tapetis subsp. tapetis]
MDFLLIQWALFGAYRFCVMGSDKLKISQKVANFLIENDY